MNLETKIKHLEQQRDELQGRIDRMKARVKGDLPRVEHQDKHYGDITVIEFDGGTSCNNPKKGYGKGYGSFQIGSGEIQRVEFGMGHSCNSAEILTLVSALRSITDTSKPILCRGDSQIALKWVSFRQTPKEKTSLNFRLAIEQLREQVKRFPIVKTEWRGRQHSVNLFGH